MRMGNRVRYAMAGLVLLVSSGSVWAEPGIGTIKTLSGKVSIERAGTVLAAQLGAPVYRSDRIITGKDGSVGVLFEDGSRISAGPGSRLELGSFSYDRATQDGNLEVAMQKGTLSVISGKMVEKRPGALRVKTPAAILAVRGTEFSVRVDEPDAQEAPQ